ncbi:3-keto-5-aminohexanoate cleavage protein [Roseomonas elaeocarpi]|uniref:3-keto-5-aminohexanoate cleavage protein n=1 Tax=Roseomonas elaeocarpi TaxID=907779 RepID=A0ABV6JQ48_9PROT
MPDPGTGPQPPPERGRPRIQACLNGARPLGFHPALPLAPEALAREAAACAAAGAVALHLHPRDAEGRETLRPDLVGAAVAAVRAASALPVSVSTGEWILRDDPARRAAVAGWGRLEDGVPDVASVNLEEADAPAVMRALGAAGIGVEAGLASREDADRFLALGIACRRVLVEIPDMPEDAALRLACRILDRLDEAGHPAERQLHGQEASVWPCFRLAMRRGLMGRLGLEDGEHLPDGTRAVDSAAILRAGMTLAANLTKG